MEEENKSENNQEETQEESKSTDKKTNPLIFVGIVVALALVALPMVLSGRKNADNDAIEQESMAEVEGTMDEGMMEGDQMEGEVQVVNVEAGSFYFKPNEIRVKKGETVKIVLTNAGGMHDFVIDEFDAKTPTFTQTGETAEVEFVADKAGEFEFYCSVGNHRAQGMVGTLIVEE